MQLKINKVKSRPLDLRAAVLIDDAIKENPKAGMLTVYRPALIDLFAETDIKAADIDKLPLEELLTLTMTLEKWYGEAVSKALKNVYSPTAE